jgi:hypothetical protein
MGENSVKIFKSRGIPSPKPPPPRSRRHCFCTFRYFFVLLSSKQNKSVLFMETEIFEVLGNSQCQNTFRSVFK